MLFVLYLVLETPYVLDGFVGSSDLLTDRHLILMYNRL